MENVIKKEDERYPALLRDIPGAPKQLFYKGVWDQALFANCLAVVGSRRMTRYGRQMTEDIVSPAAAAGITIVSGFMYGVDATAHRSALKGGGKTIAVMPCGIDLVHPAYQSDLYDEIIERGGLVVSEFAGMFEPALWTYPKRNRIVAGLCVATLVVEAGVKSGSLITAHCARRFGRTLCAVPGNATSPTSEGTNLLLKEGARVVTDAGDVLELFRAKGTVAAREHPLRIGLQNVEERVMRALSREAASIDELAAELSLDAARAGAALSVLQLSGLVEEEGGKYYAA